MQFLLEYCTCLSIFFSRSLTFILALRSSRPDVFCEKGAACNFIKKETLAQVFSCEFCKISKNTFFLQNTSGGCFCSTLQFILKSRNYCVLFTSIFLILIKFLYYKFNTFLPNQLVDTFIVNLTIPCLLEHFKNLTNLFFLILHTFH